jgi:hypothetical protein
MRMCRVLVFLTIAGCIEDWSLSPLIGDQDGGWLDPDAAPSDVGMEGEPAEDGVRCVYTSVANAEPLCGRVSGTLTVPYNQELMLRNELSAELNVAAWVEGGLTPLSEYGPATLKSGSFVRHTTVGLGLLQYVVWVWCPIDEDPTTGGTCVGRGEGK